MVFSTVSISDVSNVMGRLIEDEIRALYSFTRKNDGDKIAILAGAKIEDSIKVSESFLNNDITSYICVGGVVANAFMWASGMKIGKKNEDFIIKNNKNHDKLIKKCADLLKKHKERIIMPVDFILNPSKVRINMEDSIPDDQILADIGPDSIALFTEKIRSAASIFINGPMGMYEMSGYQSGTYEILGEIARSKGLTIAGGGHTISAIGILGVGKQIDHISTGGGVFVRGSVKPDADTLVSIGSEIFIEENREKSTESEFMVLEFNSSKSSLQDILQNK